MRNWRSVYSCARAALCALLLTPAVASAADIYVGAGGDLQAAINSAQSGDTIWLKAGATFVGSFTLPVHAGTDYVTIRSDASDTVLPPSGSRITPSYAAYLPKIQSPTSDPAIRTAPAAAYWRLLDVELPANYKGQGDIMKLGDGSSAQNDLSQLPHHLIVDRVYIHGDPSDGQKRGIGLNSGTAFILNSYISDIKAIGQDTQAIGGWNGAGPYRIENNYLEGAGENVLFGGDDPKVPNLTPTDIIIRGNYFKKPTAWQQPIVPTPSNVRPTVTGGSLPAGTYGYRVMARKPVSTTTAKSLPSAEVTVSVGAGSRVALTWNAVAGAADYVVFGRTPGGENMYWIVPSTSFADDGATAGTAGTPSSSATMWQVKNLLEMKNVNTVQVDHNLLENVWKQAQTGWAILLTPRNQYGSCTWCVVENVTLEHNVVRHMGAGVQILGYDDTYPSQQTNHIVIRNNEFSDINRSVWGGDGYYLQMTHSPRDITVDHNTIISPSGSGLITMGNGTIDQFVFTNNVARLNTYGIRGDNCGTGNSAIACYLPGSVISANALQGGSASSYPAGNLFPTETQFESHFVDYAGDNFALNTGTDWAGAGTDGLDLGAAYPVLDTVSANSFDTLQLTTTALAATTQNDGYSASLYASGGLQPYSWSLAAGALPPGLSLDQISGTISGTATAAGDYAFTAAVTDTTAGKATQPLTIHVDPYIAPVQIVTTSLPNATASVPYAQSLVAAGGSGIYTWSQSGGALPAGISLSPAGVLSGTTSQQGTFTFSVTVADGNDATRSASGSFTLTVAPPPNTPPTVSISAPVSGAVVPVGATITIAAQAADADGSVTSVAFYVGGALVGSSTGPTFSMQWLVPTSGTYAITAIASDNRGAATASAPVNISTQSEVVIRASAVDAMKGSYNLSKDNNAAGGYALVNPNHNAAKVAAPLASPGSFAEFTFYAEAGQAYHLWLRGYAQKNSAYNDSAYVQFDDVADAKIGTTSARSVNLEDCTGCGLSGWGWQDDGYGAGVLGTAIYFGHTGLQRIRLQPREDGYVIDQIVLSPAQYLATSPGALKNDTTILGTTTSTVSSGTVSASSTPVPQAWTSLDIGSVSPAGTAAVDSTGRFTVAGAGADIWGSADAFQFYYQTLAGDGEIVARVASVQNVSVWTKAAVMMRDTTRTGSAHAMTLVSPGKGTAFQRRVAAGGLSSNTYGPLAAAPYWVKMVRTGSTFTSSVSADGATWTVVGSDTIAMGSTIDVGLAVSSHVNGTLATATFDHVSVTKY